MAKRIDYAGMFTLRSDGRYMGYWHDSNKRRHAIYDRDPQRLYERIQQKETQSEDVTFQTAAETWSGKHAERVGYKTAEAYRAPTRRIIERYGDRKLGDITPQDIYAFLTELGNMGYARRTVQLHRDALNMIFNDAIVDGKTQFNPCAAVTMPRNLASTRRELPSDETIEAIRTHTSHPFSLFALLCLYAGLRRGEALALRYEDIDREKGLIHVRHAVEFIGNSPHIKRPKTEAGERYVILLDALAEAIPRKRRGYIICRANGELLSKSAYRKAWESYCSYLGVKLTAHQLRHGYATILYEAGVEDKDAQELLGHSSITVTRDIYTHIRQNRRSETAAKLNDYLTTLLTTHS